MKIIDLIFSPAAASFAAPFILIASNLAVPNETSMPSSLVDPPTAEPVTCPEVLRAAMQEQNNVHWYKFFVINALSDNVDTPDLLLYPRFDAAYESIILDTEERDDLVKDSINAVKLGRSNPLCSPTD
jgi:hypothetical protein